jgi:hypothetical protein
LKGATLSIMTLELTSLATLYETLSKIYGASKTAVGWVARIGDWAATKPSADDAKTIRAYVKRLDERRVLYVPLHAERANLVVWSLREVKNATEETKAKLEHAGLDAALGGIVDHLRKFLDTWSDEPFVGRGDDRDPRNIAFLVALGELRVKVIAHLELIKMIDPKVQIGNIIRPAATE